MHTHPQQEGIWLRFLSGPDVEELAITQAEIIDAVEGVVAAHGRGETVFEPRTHLVPNNGGVGHFNVLRGHVSTLGEHGVSGVKVVVDDWREAQSGRFGALRHHVDSGKLAPETLYAELGAIVSGQKPGREKAEERILLWHRGLSILDVAVGQLILERARAADVGTMVRYR